ncbi:Uncharacterized protein NCS13_1_0575 [Neochlamydia sp. S13]|nr:Uncharacterized protein NCS13_1_0575 [Neochlamydia sp. S13]
MYPKIKIKWLYGLLCFLFPYTSVMAGKDKGYTEYNHSHLLFLVRMGNVSQAIKAYECYHKQTGKHDFEFLQEMALLLLDQGYRCSDLNTRLMTLFGAGICLNERALYILKEGISSGIPELQLISLNFLSQYQNDQADENVQRALNTKHPLIRLEAAYLLAQKKSPRAYAYAEALMYRWEGILEEVFPEFFAMIGTPEALHMLCKLMCHSHEEVRLAAIINAAKYGCDELLYKIRTLATHKEKAQQEASAFALGLLKDENSIPTLKNLSCSNVSHVQLAAWKALYDLGCKEYKILIENAAKQKDIYAIFLLGELQESQDCLALLINDPNIQVRVNAAMALLYLQDPRCTKVLLQDILITHPQDMCYSSVCSPGKSLTAWRATPGAHPHFKDSLYAFERSLKMREEALSKALDLPEQEFLQVAKTLFACQQNDLIPLLTDLLKKLNTPAAIALLQAHQQQIGAPLIRNYCNLALYSLKVKGPYRENLYRWVTNSKKNELLQFRPFLPSKLRDLKDNYQLTLEEHSQLLIASFESLIQNKDEQVVNLLLEAMQDGNPINRYALAGLLMRAIH